MPSERATRIAELNERLRRSAAGGRVLITTGVLAHDERFVDAVVAAVRAHIAHSSEGDRPFQAKATTYSS